MSLLTTGARRVRPVRAAAAGARRRPRRPLLFALLAVALDGTAALLLLDQRLPEALAGVLLASAGWLATRRLAERRPAPPGEEPSGGAR